MYEATLPVEQVQKFMNDFKALESSVGTEVEINTNGGAAMQTVTLKPNSVNADLLEASFKDGLLRTWGWSRKFKKTSN